MPAHAFTPIAARFRRDASGVSAVEFAVTLPIMLMILVCTVEISHAIDNYRKVTVLARTLADLTAQGDGQNPIDAANMADIVAASSLVLSPYSSSSVKITVSALGVYVNVRPQVCSSFGKNTPARATGYAVDLTVPNGFQTVGMRYVLAEVSMAYVPILGSNLVKYLGNGANYTLTASTPWPVRGGSATNSSYSEVWMPNGSACPLI